jgi:hypothetical protein
MATMTTGGKADIRNIRGYRPESARWATIRVETDGGVYEGRICVPDAARRVSDVLADDRQFLSLTDVRLNDSDEAEAFMAVNKSFIRTLRILDEGVAGGGRERGRAVASPASFS